MNDISQLTEQFQKQSLRRNQLNKSPFIQFNQWFEENIKSNAIEPTAMILATSNRLGEVSTRTVLLKEFSDKGFVFFSNYASKKGADLADNPQASLSFQWLHLQRQIHIQGLVKKTTRKQSQDYFQKRPRDSQISVLASAQSRVVSNRKTLEEKAKDLQAQYQNKTIDMPKDWGGYCLTAKRIEFWQGRDNRLHDRFIYCLENKQWHIKRLAP